MVSVFYILNSNPSSPYMCFSQTQMFIWLTDNYHFTYYGHTRPWWHTGQWLHLYRTMITLTLDHGDWAAVKDRTMVTLIQDYGDIYAKWSLHLPWTMLFNASLWFGCYHCCSGYCCISVSTKLCVLYKVIYYSFIALQISTMTPFLTH